MISIIIPLYNVENFIESCLESFENQTYKDFEIIVVNDGSTDNSAELVKKYMANSTMKIRLIEQENAGVSAARNKGIGNALGQYICFVDSDDMVAPEYLSTMIDAINKKDVYDMVICGVKSVRENLKSNHISYKKNQLNVMSSDEALENFLLRNISPGVWSLMVRSEFLRRNKLFFSEGYRYSEDIEMIFKMMAYSRRIVYTKDELYLYRVRNNSVMGIVDEKRLDGLRLMENLELFFDEVAPNFAEKFRRYGVARWVWATTWQMAIASENYRQFIDFTTKLNSKEHLKVLISFPDRKVKLSSLVYSFSPRLYYLLVKNLIKKNKKVRTMSSSGSTN